MSVGLAGPTSTYARRVPRAERRMQPPASRRKAFLSGRHRKADVRGGRTAQARACSPQFCCPLWIAEFHSERCLAEAPTRARRGQGPGQRDE
jgi:hypothetical protein